MLSFDLFALFFKKIEIISDVIIPIIFFYHVFFFFFFVTLQSMIVPNFMSKAFSYQDLHNAGSTCPSLIRGMIRKKYPRGDRAKIVATSSDELDRKLNIGNFIWTYSS